MPLGSSPAQVASAILEQLRRPLTPARIDLPSWDDCATNLLQLYHLVTGRFNVVRILMLTQFYPPYIGGEERHVRNLSAHLVARGHEVAVATLGNLDLPAFEQDQGVRVYRIRGTMQRATWLFSDIPPPRTALPGSRAELGAAAHHRSRAPTDRPCPQLADRFLSAVETMERSQAGADPARPQYALPEEKADLRRCALRWASLDKCLRCVGEHYGIAKGLPVLLSNRLMSAIERRAVDMFVPVSQAVAVDNQLLGRGLPVQVIPNFVPDGVGMLPDKPHPYLAQLPSEPFMLFVGAFGRYKGLDVLLRAYAELADAPPLVIIGYQTSEYPIRTTEFPPNVWCCATGRTRQLCRRWRRCLFGLVPSDIVRSMPEQ